jgi:hypothetical protein
MIIQTDSLSSKSRELPTTNYYRTFEVSYKAQFVPALMFEYCKRLTGEILGEINAIMIPFNLPDESENNGDSDIRLRTGLSK